MDLGCDASGYSRAGSDSMIWYCVIVAGRPGLELSKLRGVSVSKRIFSESFNSNESEF